METVLQVWPVFAGFVGFFLATAGLFLGFFRLLRADIRRLEGRMDSEIGSVRNEIREVRDSLKGEIAGVRDSLKGEIAEVRDSLKGEIAEVRDSLKGEIVEMRDTLRGDIAEVRQEVTALREDVVSLKVEIGFIKGKLDLLERYILRRNDPAAAPAE